MQNKQTDTSADTPRTLVSFLLTYHEQPVQMLKECVESILALSLRSYEREIIIVDDGSAESPMPQLMCYGDSVLYVRQKNSGVSVARNTALRMARGQYVQIVDGDDKLLSVSYEHCLDIMRHNADTDMVVFDFTTSASAEATTPPPPVKNSGTGYMNSSNIRGAACCYLFRRSILGNLVFTPGVNYGEDEEFTPQLLLRAETIYVSSVQAYYYRQHSESATHRRSEEHHRRRLDDTRGVIMRLNTLSATLPLMERHALQRRVAQLTMDYIYNTIVLTRSRRVLNERLNELRGVGLFPLPAQGYTQKYKRFRQLINNPVGRTVLLGALPLMKRER